MLVQRLPAVLQGKVMNQPPATVAQIPVPQHQFSHIHVDMAGPLPTFAKGFCYLSQPGCQVNPFG
jgi:hypothetical protein